MKHIDKGLLVASFINAVVQQSWQAVFIMLFCCAVFVVILYLDQSKKSLEYSEIMASNKALEKRLVELERIVSTTSLGQAFRPTRK